MDFGQNICLRKESNKGGGSLGILLILDRVSERQGGISVMSVWFVTYGMTILISAWKQQLARYWCIVKVETVPQSSRDTAKEHTSRAGGLGDI